MSQRDRALRRYESVTEPPLLALALLTIPLVVAEIGLRHKVSVPDRRLIDVTSGAVWLAFTIDLAIRLVLTRRRLDLLRRDYPSVLIVLSGALQSTTGVFGFLRLLRPVVRVLGFSSEIVVQARAVLVRHTLAFIFFLALFTWWFSAAMILLFEYQPESTTFNSIGDGLWWSAVTMATVGYGDLSPATPAGRVVAVVTMVVGISSFALLTAKFAELLTRIDLREIAKAVPAEAPVDDDSN